MRIDKRERRLSLVEALSYPAPQLRWFREASHAIRKKFGRLSGLDVRKENQLDEQ
ncbi:MAG: hypothetical protein GY820_22950 [Gammaproteobacteria bacterium]|nr:hypothetical protein [Gammaproteobacteria bacterium]